MTHIRPATHDDPHQRAQDPVGAACSECGAARARGLGADSRRRTRGRICVRIRTRICSRIYTRIHTNTSVRIRTDLGFDELPRLGIPLGA